MLPGPAQSQRERTVPPLSRPPGRNCIRQPAVALERTLPHLFARIPFRRILPAGRCPGGPLLGIKAQLLPHRIPHQKQICPYPRRPQSRRLLHQTWPRRPLPHKSGIDGGFFSIAIQLQEYNKSPKISIYVKLLLYLQ